MVSHRICFVVAYINGDVVRSFLTDMKEQIVCIFKMYVKTYLYK